MLATKLDANEAPSTESWGKSASCLESFEEALIDDARDEIQDPETNGEDSQIVFRRLINDWLRR